MTNLKEYTYYFSDESLIDTGITSLEGDFNKNHEALKKDLLVALKDMKKDFKVIKSFQSISKFTDLSLSYGWKNIYKDSNNLKDVCEKNVIPENCINQISNLQEFISNSTLADSTKETLLKELDYYQYQQEVVFKYDSNFISRFDSLVSSYNKLKSISVEDYGQAHKSLITGKDETKKEVHVLENALQEKKTVQVLQNVKNEKFSFDSMYSNYLILGAVFLVVPVLIFVIFRKIRNSLFVRQNRKKLISICQDIQKKSEMKVRIFGKLEKEYFLTFSENFSKYSEIFSKTGKYYGELHFRFSKVKKDLRLEVRYLSSVSLSTFYQMSLNSGVLDYQSIIEKVESVGGEVMFSTYYDQDGKINYSNFIITLPKS